MAGFRHTGEVLELTLVSLPALQLGPIRRSPFPVAVMDLTAWQHVAPVAGVLSLQLLEHTPFELDVTSHRLILNPASTQRNPTTAVESHVAVIRQHPATVEIDVPLFLAGQPLGWAQLDTGSPQTYIHAWWKPLLNQHGRKLYAKEQQSWTGRRDSVEYWSVHGLAFLGPTAIRDSATVEVGTIVSASIYFAKASFAATSMRRPARSRAALARPPRRPHLTNAEPDADPRAAPARCARWRLVVTRRRLASAFYESDCQEQTRV
jgi:hypothetical protein